MKTEQEIRDRLKFLDLYGWKIFNQKESDSRTVEILTNNAEIKLLEWILND